MSAAPAGPRGSDGRTWVSWRLLREVVLRLHYAYRALPARARHRWWAGMLLGAALVQLLTWATVRAAQALERTGHLRWEAGALRALEVQPLLSWSLAMWLEGLANGFIMWLLMLFAAGVAAWRRRPLLCLSILVGYTLVYAPIATGWALWARERPDLIASGVAAPGGIFRSFPSGHTLQGVFAHGILVYLWMRHAPSALERWAAAGVWALLIGLIALGRLRLGSHWPSDIAGGLVLGLGWLGAVVLALRAAEAARDDG